MKKWGRAVLAVWLAVMLLSVAVARACPPSSVLFDFYRMEGTTWAAEWFWQGEPSGTFTIKTSVGEKVCSGIGDATTCNCQWNNAGDWKWARCLFTHEEMLKFRKVPYKCLVDLWWVEDGAETYLLSALGRCSYTTALPLIQVSSE